MTCSYLTTVDNPYDPHTQFDLWFSFDTQKGYNSCNYLARIARTSPDCFGTQNSEDVDAAIDEIIRFNGSGFYKKVTVEI